MSSRSTVDVLEEIERKFSVEKIKANNLQIWPILRMALGFEISNRAFKASKVITPLNLKRILKKTFKILAFLLSQVKTSNKYHPYILFTNTLEDRYDRSSGKYIDKLFHGMISELKNRNIVIHYIESADDAKNAAQYYYKNIEHSQYFFSIFYKISSVKKIEYEHEDLLKKILYGYDLYENYNKIIREFFTIAKVFSIYFKLKKPKAVFYCDSYSSFFQAMTYSAKKMGIKTIEVQHGVINNRHFGYKIFKDIGKDVFPEFIISFGDYYTNILKNNFVAPEKIYPVGSFYNDYTKMSLTFDHNIDDYFNCLRRKYKKIIICTGDKLTQKRVIKFILHASYLDKSIAYIYLPRVFSKDLENINSIINVFINKDLSFYKTINYCDFHMTVISTCALEAFCFGKASILINIDNLVELVCSEEFAINEFTTVINSPEELVNCIQNWSLPDINKMISYGETLFKNDYKKNLRKCLNDILHV